MSSTKRQNIAEYYKNKSREEKIKKIYVDKMNTELEEKYKSRAINKKINEIYKDNYANDSLIEIYQEKRTCDPIYKIIDNLANRATKILRKKDIERSFTHMELIGCDSVALKQHISNQFIDNMTFENYPEWEVDHIKPIASYDLTKLEELLGCFNYKNLQPLWKHDNRVKSAKCEQSELRNA
jgi:hypothetical protein